MAILKSYIAGDHTKFNDLKFGDVKSLERQPIVQKDIPKSFGESGPTSNGITKRVDDLQRIATILTQPPGIKYLANETALNAIKTAPKQPGIKGKLEVLANNVLGTLKTVGSTLAQVPLNGTGTHFVKGFQGIGKGTYLHQIGMEPSIAPHSVVREGSKVNIDPTVIRDRKGTNYRNFSKTDLNPVAGENKFSDFPLVVPTDFDQKKYDELDKEVNEEKYFRKEELNLENRVGLGNPANKLLKRGVIYNTANISTQDKINILKPLDSKPTDSEGNTGLTGDTGRDLVKFRFQVITPSDKKDNPNTKHLYFRAYIDSFNDSFNGDWNSFNYVGRGEQFHTYSGFSRSISLSFKIAAQSRQEMRPLYQKIVYLASATAPNYSSTGYMRGTFTKLTVGDYIYEMPGFLNSVQYNWETNYPWEIALGNPDDQGADIDQQELPMVLNCSINFTPIHKFTPETGLKHYITREEMVKGREDTRFFYQGKAVDVGDKYIKKD